MQPLIVKNNLYGLIFTEDILNVRLQTLGVKEHSFDISMSGTRVNWLLYDVGGAVRLSLLIQDSFLSLPLPRLGCVS